MTKLYELREELKRMAIEIRKQKVEDKEYQRRHNGNSFFFYRNLGKDYRHMHIAYCLLRGRTMEQIESKNRENNKPNTYLINEYMEKYREETICVNQV